MLRLLAPAGMVASGRAPRTLLAAERQRRPRGAGTGGRRHARAGRRTARRHPPGHPRTRHRRRQGTRRPSCEREAGNRFVSQILDTDGTRPGLGTRLTTHTTVTVARLLAHLPPRRLRAVLGLARRGARPARSDDALQARKEVTAVSTLGAGRYRLQRSLATALLCRMRGHRPTWRSGLRTTPFGAHAWVEAEGRPFGRTPGHRHMPADGHRPGNGPNGIEDDVRAVRKIRQALSRARVRRGRGVGRARG